MAREHRTCGYDRLVGTLCNLGHRISDQTVGNILRRSQIAPRRSGVARPPARWHRLLHVEVLTWRGLITYYILFFIEVGSRRVSLGGILTAPRVPGQVRHEAPCCTVMLPATKRHVGQNLTPERLGKSSHFVANGIFRGAQRQVGEPAARVSHLARITPDRPM